MAPSNSNTIAFSDSSAAELGLLCLLVVQTFKNHYFYETTKIDIYKENKLALLWYLLLESCLTVGWDAPGSESQNCIFVKGFEILFFCP